MRNMINPIYLKDAYKMSHYEQYPKGTTLLFSNFTPRKSRMPGINHSVFFGLRYFLMEYLKGFERNFFTTQGRGIYKAAYKSIGEKILGSFNSSQHIEDLNSLGYLPIEIYALPEGSVVPCCVP